MTPPLAFALGLLVGAVLTMCAFLWRQPGRTPTRRTWASSTVSHVDSDGDVSVVLWSEPNAKGHILGWWSMPPLTAAERAVNQHHFAVEGAAYKAAHGWRADTLGREVALSPEAILPDMPTVQS